MNSTTICSTSLAALLVAQIMAADPLTKDAVAPAQTIPRASLDLLDLRSFERPRDVPHGTVATETYQSKSLGFERKVTVYTPPGYDKSKKYPVLYLLHGSGDDETGWVQKGSANVILDNLYSDHKAAPMIVVMPNGFPDPAGTTRRATTPEERQKSMSRFEQDLLQDVVPLIESRYSVLPDQRHRALAGLSMGGGQTMRIGPTHPETFSYLGVFSAGMRRPTNGTPALDVTASYPPATKLNESLKLFWVSCGDRDPGLEGAKKFESTLTEKNITHIWHEDSGAHEWPVWKNDLYLIAQRLFKEE